MNISIVKRLPSFGGCSTKIVILPLWSSHAPAVAAVCYAVKRTIGSPRGPSWRGRWSIPGPSVAQREVLLVSPASAKAPKQVPWEPPSAPYPREPI